ncbi:MAG: hypothetical protein HUJ72_01800 [Blautia sp.]|nr:hypothetical protein [Blautia sp.]
MKTIRRFVLSFFVIAAILFPVSITCITLPISAYAAETKAAGSKKGLVLGSNGRYQYYLNNGEMLKSSWKVVNGKTYWFTRYGNSAKLGLWKVKGSYYLFDEDSALIKPAKDTIKTVKKKKYFVSAKGTVVTGWITYKNKLYYAPENDPALKTSGSHQGISFNKDGSAKPGTYTNARLKASGIVSSITKPSMTKAQKLNACWNYVIRNTHYALTYPDLNQKGWQQKLAYRVLTSHGGNCYGFACAFAALAAEIGYDPYLVCGRIPGKRDQASDGMTRHCWVRIDNRYYDPEAQSAGFAHVYGSAGYPMRHTIQQIVNYISFV